jgi:amidase
MEQVHEISADRPAYAFRPDIEPRLRIQPGEMVRFHTSSEYAERLFAAGENWLEALDVRAINSVTGPVYVEGTQPGDAVSVEILDVTPEPWGWNAFIPQFGLLDGRLSSPMLRRVPIQDGRVIISERLSLRVKPMIGCLGLAPARGVTSTLEPVSPWGGNYDVVHASPGNTFLFPVQVPGGLFSLGDLHAAMGWAEATSVSVECAGSATVRLGVRKGLTLTTPRIEAPGRLYTIGIGANRDYEASQRQATGLMFDYLTKERGLSEGDAYVLCSAAVDLEYGGPASAITLAGVALEVLGERS